MGQVPQDMLAVRYDGAGGAEVVRTAREPVPTPGPGELLVAVAAAGLNRADLVQRAGDYPVPPGASEIPGLEVSGTVVAVGPEAGMPGEGRFGVGDRVCALLAGGGYAEHVVVPAGQLMAVPEGVDLVDAAAFPEVACTVHSNLVGAARVQAGEWALVHGATGGIGSFAVQYLAATGVRVLGTAGGEAKVARALELGAEAAFDHRSAPSGAFADWVREVTDGHGADVVLDVVGGPYLAPNVRALAMDGRIVVIAVQGGPVPEDFHLMRLAARRGWVTGSLLRPRPVAGKARIVAATERAVWPLVAAGRIHHSVTARFPLAQATQAQEFFDAADRTGKVLLVTDDADVRLPEDAR